MYGLCILKNNSGFTLLETLGAFIVFVVLISGAYSLLIQSIKLHQREHAVALNSFILFNKIKTPKKTIFIKDTTKKFYIKCSLFEYKDLSYTKCY